MKRMKTKLHSNSLLKPLAGSIRALLALTTFTPLIGGLHSSAADATTTRPLTKAKASPNQTDESKNANALSPEDSLATGLKYLLAQQHSDGGWGQGGGWRQNTSQNSRGGRVEGPNVEDPSDLGNTAACVVTLLRAGLSPAQGEHHKAMAKAFDFICRQVEGADKDSLYVTDVRDTQLQVKIGTYVDTFLAGWALSELKGKVADDAAEKRRAAALDKVVGKIAHNQRDDGSFNGNNGWAAVLSQGLCSKALNLASRSGAKVDQGTLDKAQKQNIAGLDVSKGDFAAPSSPAAEPSSAGVSLYREAAKLNGLLENSWSNASRKQAAEKTMNDKAAPAEAKAQAEKDLQQIDKDDKAAVVANSAVASKLGNLKYLAGFGNNGGEEFLSYMNITEGVHQRGGKEWEDWRSKMTKTVCGAQNADGSWAGQHCITGRTFCTATALLTLLVEQENDNAHTSSTNTQNAPVAVK
jgi:hypothetical protein